MNEFRDARKAMEMAINEEHDSGRSRVDGGDRAKKSAKKRPVQPLLRAAIMNHASRGKDSGP